MRVCIHRGSRQIGGSCVEVNSKGQRLLLDLGLPLDAEANDPQYLPVVRGLDGSDSSLLGIMISHPHLDHFGLLAHIPESIPVGMGAAARRVLEAAIPFLPGNWPTPSTGWHFQSAIPFDVGPFRVTPFLVDHSAYDAYSFLIEADDKRLFYSGDFRGHGRKSRLLDRLIANPPDGVDVLLVEGSSLGRLETGERFPTENEIEAQLVQAFVATKGMVLVHASIQNIDRIVSILRACRKSGRRLVIDLYAAAILEATDNPNLPQSDWPDVALFVPQLQRVQIKNNAWFDLLKRHSTNRIFIDDLQKVRDRSVLLFRPLHIRDLEKSGCVDGARYVYSQWAGYWERGAYDSLRSWLALHNIPQESIHTSGHASPDDLKRFVSALAPRKVVPIHTFAPERYPELFDNVEYHNDGDWWEA
jgi:ribonuclease J